MVHFLTVTEKPLAFLRVTVAQLIREFSVTLKSFQPQLELSSADFQRVGFVPGLPPNILVFTFKSIGIIDQGF